MCGTRAAGSTGTQGGHEVEIVTKSVVSAYLESDPIRKLIASNHERYGELTCQRWLMESPPKRAIYKALYGDLLRGEGLRVLDVGGGLSSLTRLLSDRHQYTLIDLMAHDKPEIVSKLMTETPGARYVVQDWYGAQLEARYDVVVANDLFPNVDQRLDLFLRTVLPRAREVRLSLTYYDTPRFYMTRRLDGDEILCLLAWSGEATRTCMTPYASRIRGARLDLFSAREESPFPNGRQVCLAVLDGDQV
jgi:hypothetical protein